MNPIVFSRLFDRHGGYSLPVLIELKHPENPVIWYFTSNDLDVRLNGKEYRAVSMNYKFPSSKNGVPQGGVLEIDTDIHNDKGYELLKWFDESDHSDVPVGPVTPPARSVFSASSNSLICSLV